MADWDTVLRINPRRVEAYDNRGQVRQKLGGLDADIADLNKANAIDFTQFKAPSDSLVKLTVEQIPVEGFRLGTKPTVKRFDSEGMAESGPRLLVAIANEARDDNTGSATLSVAQKCVVDTRILAHKQAAPQPIKARTIPGTTFCGLVLP